MKRQIRILSITFTLLILCGSGDLFAQREHEFSVFGGGGLSTFSYKAAAGEQKSGFGGNFGFDYRFFFSPKWGVGTGAEFALFNAGINIDDFEIRYMATDTYLAADGETVFEFRSAVSDFEEKHHATLLKIPMMVQFQTDGGRRYYIAAGGKVGIPLTGKYDTSASLRNSGYYEHENSLYDTQEFMGFGSFPGRKSDGDVDFKTVFFVSVEGGVKWKMGDKLSVYTGAYLDYGLNNILDGQTAAALPNLVEYNSANPRAFALNGAIKSKAPGAAQALIGEMKPTAVGIKVKVAFGK